ncbi:MAG: hypothetical protein M0T85_02475 [Dehalococcoidales bacterium]|nr:hypothetical protein [Dehalococcoidales bacterium]
MAFTEEQQKIIRSYLRRGGVSELDGPTMSLELSKREVCLLLDALDHYHDTKCQILGAAEACADLVWAENVQTGALETTCTEGCERIISKILNEKALAAFKRGRAR